MLQITSKATTYLQRVRTERGLKPTNGARFVHRNGRVALTFAPAPQPGDRVVPATGISVYVASEVADKLDRSLIDVRRRQDKLGLTILRREHVPGTGS